MDDGRGELVAIAGEAVTLLRRELARGRRKIELPGIDGEAPMPAAPRGAASASRSPEAPVASAPTAGATPLTLPGFEPPAPPLSAPWSAPMPAPVRLAPRSDLPGTLAEVKALVDTCRLCPLCETRTRTVFSDGTDKARLMFVGEAPGRDEDLQGVPFVGRAGQLLTKMIEAIQMKRADVYIANVLKCRPPENRTPIPSEVEKCLPYLEQQIALVRPDLIVALGLSAAQGLLGTKASMGALRGRMFEYKGVPLVATYHPAALLRNPGLKKDAWVDLQRVRDLLREGAPA
ncbi:MAG TPA: uracil-DNA glycosylase family protein [Candidatus Eisenbacteria bacterium]|nr:uracil-DNA glycosylase family protein [Candidatus Eisenbacteria bacterium]